jgi:molybdopterin synthase sulfur carrier subunit
VKVLYFAWLRSKVGTAVEVVTPPPTIVSVNDLIGWLKSRSPGHSEAFSDIACIRAAINQEFVNLSTEIPSEAEVAFFPPVTGG